MSHLNCGAMQWSACSRAYGLFLDCRMKGSYFLKLDSSLARFSSLLNLVPLRNNGQDEDCRKKSSAHGAAGSKHASADM